MKEFVLLPKLACAAPVAFLFALCDELSFHFMLLVCLVAQKKNQRSSPRRWREDRRGGDQNRGRRRESESESEKRERARKATARREGVLRVKSHYF
jgi:hypothetical protein